MDLTDPRYAYMFGFLQADGSLWQGPGNKGKLQVELAADDQYILEQFASLVPCYSSVRLRQRSTNFKVDHQSVIWTVNDLGFRQELIRVGLTSGRKSATVTTPRVPFSQPDYFRGLIDADGSVGLSARGYPFVSLVTISDAMAAAYVRFVQEVTGTQKTFSRNVRDHAINLATFMEAAQQLVAAMYYDGCLALPRKLERAQAVLHWTRPVGMRRVIGKRIWTEYEDRFALSHPVQQSAVALGRTESSITMRLWRLRSR